MKINEIKKIYEAAPTTFTPTHYGGAFGVNPLMLHSDGKLYFRAQGQIQPWQGNPTGTGLLGRFNPATVKGRIVNGQKVPYGPGENFSNDPTAKPGSSTSTWKDPDAQPTQAARPVTGASYDQGLLRRGSRGAGVKELQQKLGMPESEQDGIFGPKTEAAVKKLQQSQGIKVDGIVGPETRGAIAKLQAPEDKSAPAQTPPTSTTTEPTPEPEEEPEATPEPEEEPEATPEPEEEPEEEPDPEEEPEATPDEPVASGVVTADTIRDRLSDDAKEKFDEQMQKFDGDLLAMLVDAKKQADDFFQQPQWRRFYQEVFGIRVSGGRVTDRPNRGVIDISTIPDRRPGDRSRRGVVFAAPGDEKYNSALGRIKYKTIDDMEESRILDLAGVDMKKKLDEASISINGADSSEVAEILRMMQLAGAEGAKVVEPGDITPKPKPMPMPTPGGCGMDKPEPGMGDMIRMVSMDKEDEDIEEADYDGGFADATTEPDEEYMSSTDSGYPAGNDLHKQKKSHKATAGGDNPMNTESLESELKSKLIHALAEKKAKPDYIDIDGDGDKEEPMKKAAKEKKSKGIQAMIDAGNKKADAEAKEGYKIGKFKKRHKQKKRFM
jgi:hypothetical protein